MENQHLCPGCFSEKADLSVCPTCGYDESQERSPILLAHRTVLNEQYLIGKVLGKPGGFGITYLAWDMYLQTYVAIKEFLPRDLAGRANDRATVQPHTNDDSKLFSYGLEQFINEARTLAQFDHPNVVRVKTFFKNFGTAYMVMDYYDGMSLNEYMTSKGNVLGETITLGIMYPILDGLHEVHNKGFLHRDIKPHNIFLTSSKRVILLDFGAARVSMNERSKSMSVVLTPGFAPPEQYHGKGKQGPWTDIYAVAATMYFMMTGSVPAEATERLYEDQLPTVKDMKPEISQTVSDALHRAMAIRAEDRPQSIPEFQSLLAGMSIPSAPSAPAPAPAPKTKAPVVEADSAPTVKQESKMKWIIAAVVIIAIAVGGWFGFDAWQKGNLEERYTELMAKGDASMTSGAYRDAITSFGEAAKLKPEDSISFDRKQAATDSMSAAYDRLKSSGLQLANEKKFDDAEKTYQSALALTDDPTEVNSLITNLGEMKLAEERRAVTDQLIAAVRSNNLTSARAALDAGAVANVRDGNGTPIIYHAVFNGSLPIVRELILRGSQANPKTGTLTWPRSMGEGWYGSTPVIAAGQGHLDILRFLLEDQGISVNDQEMNPANGELGWDALQSASHFGRTSIVDYLIGRNANVNRVIEGNTPLMVASAAGQSAVIRRLSQAGANLTQAMSDGRTPYSVAKNDDTRSTLKSLGVTAPFNYVNEFSATSLLFPAGTVSGRSTSYSGGLLQIQVTDNLLHRINPSFQVDLTRDITLTTRVRHNVAPSTAKQVGLMFGELDGKYHVFTVRTDGTLYIGQYNGSAWVALDNFVTNTAIRRGALYNVLKIEKRGTSFTFFVNDTQVARHTIASLHGNRFGVVVEGEATVDYDYFYLTGTQN